MAALQNHKGERGSLNIFLFSFPSAYPFLERGILVTGFLLTLFKLLWYQFIEQNKYGLEIALMGQKRWLSG